MNLTDEQVEKIIREYLPNVIHMSLATCANGTPWICEVHYVFDDDLNLYFRSKKSTRHAQEIEKNPQVAGNIVEPHNITMKPRCVSFEGTAEQLQDVKETETAYIQYRDRLGTGSEILEEALREDGHKFYKITIDKLYLFDTRESKPSQKYTLKWKGK